MTNRNDAPTGAAGGEPHDDPQQISQWASDLLFALANRASGGRGFVDGYEAACRRNPTIARAERGERIFANRAYDPEFVLSVEDQQIVNEGAKILRERMEGAEWRRHHEGGQIFAVHPRQIEERALRWLDSVKGREGLTYPQALDLMETRFPLLFATWAVNQTAAPGEVRRFA